MEKPTKAERITLVRSFLVTMPCPAEDCDGQLNFNGHNTNTKPPLFTHVCRVCERVVQLSKQYPSVAHHGYNEKLPDEFERALVEATPAVQPKIKGTKK